MVEIPVWIISSGYIREYGLMGEPWCIATFQREDIDRTGGRRTVNVQVILRKHLRAVVNGLTGTVEDTTQHVLCDRELHAAAGELNVGGLDIDARCAFEDLNDRFLALNLKHLTAALRAIGKSKLYNLIV